MLLCRFCYFPLSFHSVLTWTFTPKLTNISEETKNASNYTVTLTPIVLHSRTAFAADGDFQNALTKSKIHHSLLDRRA